jgi:hypothetical protein
VTQILVAPVGTAPATDKSIAFLRGQVGTEEIIAHMEKNVDRRRYFTVIFKNDAFRVIYPDPGDPAKFEIQFARDENKSLLRLRPGGDERLA